jgi:hypothetical protein
MSTRLAPADPWARNGQRGRPNVTDRPSGSALAGCIESVAHGRSGGYTQPRKTDSATVSKVCTCTAIASAIADAPRTVAVTSTPQATTDATALMPAHPHPACQHWWRRAVRVRGAVDLGHQRTQRLDPSRGPSGSAPTQSDRV